MDRRREVFVVEYLKDLNARQAAIRAGYSARTAKQQGHRLLTNADLSQRIEAALAERKVQAIVESERIEREAEWISVSDIRRLYDASGRFLPIHQIPDDLAAAIASIETVSQKGGDGVEQIRRVKFWDKNSAQKTLFQLRGDGKVNDQNVNVKGGLALRDECTELARRMTQEEVERGAELGREILALDEEMKALYEAVRARISHR